MPLINYEINLILTWSRNCVLTDIIRQDGASNADPLVEEIRAPTNATFKIKHTKLYIAVVTLSIRDYKKLLQQLKSKI